MDMVNDVVIAGLYYTVPSKSQRSGGLGVGVSTIVSVFEADSAVHHTVGG